MATVDDICPAFVATKRIALLPASTAPAQAFASYDIDVSIDLVADSDGTVARVGLMLPLELIVTAPSAENFFRHVYEKVIPSVVAFTPKEAGLHRVVLREVFHNRIYGSLDVSVAGEIL